MSTRSRSTVLSLILASLLAHPIEAHAEAQRPTYALIDSTPLAGSVRWDYLSFDKDSSHLFITRGDSVDILDVTSKNVIGTIGNLEGVHGVAIAHDLNKGFISEGKANRVTIFDLTTLKAIATAPTGKKPDAIIYDPATKRIFAANGESDELTVIDVTTNTVLGTIKLNGAPEFMAVDGKGRLYVNLEDKAQIESVDTKKMKSITSYNLAPTCEGPTGLALDKRHGRLFSTCANKTMLVVDTVSGKILDALSIGQHSDAATYDEDLGLAFSSNGDGTLSVIGLSDDGHYHVVQNVETKVSARTMALDPLTHKIYLAAAETEGFDPPTEKRPDPRPHIKPDTFMILTVGSPQ